MSTRHLILFLCLPLVVLFGYALFADQHFFKFLAFGLVACILLLLPLRVKFIRTQSNLELSILDLFEQINLLESSMQKEKTAIHALGEKIVTYSQLKGMTENLSMCLTLEDTTKALPEETNKLFGTKDSTVILYQFHSKTGELGISSSLKDQMRVNLKAKKGDIFDQWVVKTLQPLFIEDTKSDYRFDMDKVQFEDQRPIRSLISVPLVVGHKALGILRIDAASPNVFSTEDLRFLQTIADVGALATENAQLYERVEQLGIRDGLTQLYLRRHLLERLNEEFVRQMRRQKDLSFMIMDIDKFKQYNDKFGHTAGDIVLKWIAQQLQEFFNQPGGLVCRYGGEEFCVLLPEIGQKEAKKLAEEFRKKVDQGEISLRRKKTQVSLSIGVSSYPKNAQTKDELIQKADQALYKAKEEGRNRVCEVA